MSRGASPALHDGRLYWVSDRGVACCLDAKTGKEIDRQRIGAKDRVYADRVCADRVCAPAVLAGDQLYIPTRDLGVVVLAAAPEYKVLATSQLGPAVAGDQLLLHTDRMLYCIGK